MTRPRSAAAARALAVVEGLQERFKTKLEACARAAGHDQPALERHEWLRDEGRHGGGARYAAGETPAFNRAAINVSQVHYDDDPSRRLASATALSTIIHPAHPRAPSVHMHFSWTEMKAGGGYWRMMADLNPAIPDDAQTARFAEILRAAAPTLYAAARDQGDRYFYIPALERHRGATHFYLESYASEDPEADLALARGVGEAAIDGYVTLLGEALATVAAGSPSADERAAQLAYHTLYLFQVLTLDRGTTSGLLVHDQNDLGIMGSLPAWVDRERLASWVERTPGPQRPLVESLVEALAPGASPGQASHVDDAARLRLAAAVRAHYQAHPEAAALLASGDVLPPTVENHERSSS
nr:coproporphyrinogen III oxidase [Pseudenhygromyxa sp. WMMC2535]